MKNIIFYRFFLLFLLMSHLIDAKDYYVSPNGKNNTETGRGLSADKAWKTIRYALNHIPSGKHTVRLGEGTIREFGRVYLPKGISLIGAGKNKTTLTVNYYFDITTTPEKFNSVGKNVGYDPYPENFVIHMNDVENQVLKGFRLDGQSDKCHGGILVSRSNGLTIEDMKITDFHFSGIWIQRGFNLTVKNNEFIDNAFGHVAKCMGNLMLWHGKDIKIFNNSFTQLEDDQRSYGVQLQNQAFDSFFGYRFTKIDGVLPYLENFEFYENTIAVTRIGAWEHEPASMAMNLNGPTFINSEIHHNTFNNCISLTGGFYKELDLGNTRSIRVHNNRWNMGDDGKRYAIEANLPNLEIDHNYFEGGQKTIATFGGKRNKNQDIHNNVFVNNIYHQYARENAIIDIEPKGPNFRFVNNTIVVTESDKKMDFIIDGDGGTSGMIRNNLILNFSDRSHPAKFDSQNTYGSLEVRNNIYYKFSKLSDIEKFSKVLSESLSKSSIIKLSGNKPHPYYSLANNSPAKGAGVFTNARYGHVPGQNPDVGANLSGQQIGAASNIPGSGGTTGNNLHNMIITLQANNKKYVSSENGVKPIMSNRSSVGNWERFTVVDSNNDGIVALKGNNGKYVSSENGEEPINCNRDKIGSYEKFEWIDLGDGKVALKGNNNKYISSENGLKAMTCNREKRGSWETFNYEIVDSKFFENALQDSFTVSPNPSTDGIISLTTSSIDEESIKVYDLSGRSIGYSILSRNENNLQIKLQASTGIYIVQARNDKNNSQMQTKVIVD